MESSPAGEYDQRLRFRLATLDAYQQRDRRFSAARLATFAGFVLLAVGAARGVWSSWLLAGPGALFVVLVRRHELVIRARDAAGRAVAFYQRGQARIKDRWAGGGDPGDRFRDEHHLYANDLDLFGRGSLFELLSVARTEAGEERLASWLCAPAPVPELSARHAAVGELSKALDFRERIAVAGTRVGAAIRPALLVEWARGTPLLSSRALRTVAALLTCASIAALGYWIATRQPGPFFVVVFAEILFWFPIRSRVARALHAAEGPARDLDVLSELLRHIECSDPRAEKLRGLHARLGDAGLASGAVARLHTLVDRHDWQHNPFFAPVGAALLWGTHLAFSIEAWRARFGAQVPVWLDAVAEIEALSSLATYAFEHPSDVFPEIVEGPALFAGTGMSHPLLPAASAIRNDVTLDDTVRLLIVSGSNMSGKSTLLRTVGINVVLALAGAPVRAHRLRVSPLTLGATLRIQDSLQEGRSRFYAEITRIRQLSDCADKLPPLMFLLDELLHGTNSHDRLIGASGVLRSLIDRGAIGLVTTHDLALTDVAHALAPHAVNVHFEDRFEADEIRFDYRMKPGPVTRSNAIALMRAVGLQVDG